MQIFNTSSHYLNTFKALHSGFLMMTGLISLSMYFPKHQLKASIKGLTPTAAVTNDYSAL